MQTRHYIVFIILSVSVFNGLLCISSGLGISRNYTMCKLDRVDIATDKIGFQSISLVVSVPENSRVQQAVFHSYHSLIQDQVDILTAYYVKGKSYTCTTRGEKWRSGNKDGWITHFDIHSDSDAPRWYIATPIIVMVVSAFVAILGLVMGIWFLLPIPRGERLLVDY